MSDFQSGFIAGFLACAVIVFIFSLLAICKMGAVADKEMGINEQET